jgi:outer membrane cobalamin receptor
MNRVLPLLLAGCLLALGPSSLFAARVTGTVRGPDGQPVAAARIVVERPTGTAVVAVASPSGDFALDLPPGTYVVRVVAEGLAADPQTVILGEHDAAPLRLDMRLAALAETVVVSGGQVPMPRSALGVSLTVIDQEELRTRQLESAQDALRSVPGLTLSRTGGRGAVTSMFPRGGESDFTLVMVDGIRLNDLGGAFDVAHLPLFDLEQIEVVRGPQSSTYGSDAIGGVVQLVTRRGGPAQVTSTVEAGSFGTGRANVAAAGTWQGVRWGGGIERLESDGFTGTAPATGEQVSNDDYARTDATLSLGYLGPRWQASGLLRGGRNERGNPGPFGSDPNNRYGAVDRVSRGENETFALGTSAAVRVRPTLQARGQFTLADRDSTFVSRFSPTTPTMATNRMRAGRAQLDGSVTPRLSWTTGAELSRERAGSSFITDGVAPIEVERDLLGVFAEARAEHGRLSLQAGVRSERISRDALGGNPTAFTPRPDFPRDVVVSVNPRVSANVRLADAGTRWTRLRANAGTGIRPPSAFEIAFTDNPGLRPERSRSLDGGVEQGLLAGRLVVDTTYFWNDFDDMIITVGRSLADTSRYVSDNLSNARTQGLETTVAGRPAAALTIRAGYVWQRTRILAVDGGSGRAPTPFRTGDRLLRRPGHSGFVDAMVRHDRVSGFFRLDGRGQSLDIDPSFGASGGLFDNPGYTVADAGLAVDLTRRLQFHLRATNLFNRGYEEILGFPGLGRGLMGGVRVAAGR